MLKGVCSVKGEVLFEVNHSVEQGAWRQVVRAPAAASWQQAALGVEGQARIEGLLAKVLSCQHPG
jgi:hypothetical protein